MEWARTHGDCECALGAVDGIHYLLAADGISRTLVLLTGIAAVSGVLFSWNIEVRTNEFFAFFLALIAECTESS